MDNLIPDFDDFIPNLEDTPIVEDVLFNDETPDVEETIEQVYAEGSDPMAITVYEELKQRGYYVEDTFDGKWDSLDNYFEKLPQLVLNSVVEQLPTVSKDVMQFIATAGENITVDEMKNFFKTKFEQEEVQELSTLDDARNFLKNHYIEQGIKEKAVDRMLDALEDDDELEQIANEEYRKKNQVKKTDLLIQSKQEENDKIANEKSEFIGQVNDELSKLDWKPEKVNRVKSLLSTSNFSNALKEIINNPKSLVQLADMIDNYDKQNHRFNLSHIEKQIESKKTLSIKDKLEKNQFSSAGAVTKAQRSSLGVNKNLVPIFD